MERIKLKSKKDKQQKHADKDNTSSFITDVKSIKENLKIKEILRTVKMNSSMRIKAPRGSKVMNSKDFNDIDDLFEENNKTGSVDNPQAEADPLPSATNHDVILNTEETDTKQTKTDTSDYAIVMELETDKHIQNEQEETRYNNHTLENDNIGEHSKEVENEKKLPDVPVMPEIKFLVDNPHMKNRDRKLSLDQTMLRRQEGLSQSELDLHSIGKSPLERKSSFFRKKMESFFKNTTEIFKRQSMSSKPENVQRRGSMSVSLQSLNEKSSDYNSLINNNQGSCRSLRSTSTVGRSTSSLTASQTAGASEAGMSDAGISEVDSLSGSQPLLSASQPLTSTTADSLQNLNEAYAQESMLNSRAISMNSGLDSAHASRRRRSNSSRTNRVTWVASEGLAHYFRRLIQDEKSNEIQVCHSYADFTTIPENELCGPRLDNNGRRLSYQRAVSGEDPVVASRYDNSLRRGLIPEHEAAPDITQLLDDFTRNGVPPLAGFAIANISDEAFAYLIWAEEPQNLEDIYDVKKLTPMEESRQAVIRELLCTEAVHIRHLKSIVEVFIAAAHALQDAGRLLDVDTEKLFLNIPDVLNASLVFWEVAMYPMISNAVEKGIPFNTELMSSGFYRFREIFAPYEKFVTEQTKILDYLRVIQIHNAEFNLYLSWCHSQKECNRLQLGDILVKPLQRLTKYSLILRRIIGYTETEPERTSLIAMDRFSKNYVLDVNRTIRQREELEKLDILANSIESYEIEFKDDDLDRYFRMFSQLNLKAPMLNCLPLHSRSLIYEGDLHFRDKDKELEVRVFLLTDMILITKKQSKGLPYKLIRPKYFIDKLVHINKPNTKTNKEIVALIFVVLDEVSSAYNAFLLTDSEKNTGPSTLKQWDIKLREAKLTYEIAVWFAKNPSHDLSEVEMDSSSDYAYSGTGKQPGVKQNSEELTIARGARERVATMLHRCHTGTSTEYDFSQASMPTDSFDGYLIGAEASGASGGRAPGLHNIRHPMYRTSTGGSSRQSRLSSFHQSTSAASHDEPHTISGRNIYRAGSSVEHLIPPFNPEDKSVTSITVNVVGESESEPTEPQPAPALPASPSPRAAPPHICHQPRNTGSRSPGLGNTLRVQPQGGVLALVHSLPDLTVEATTSRPPHVRRVYRQSPIEVDEPIIGIISVRQEPQSGVLALFNTIHSVSQFLSLIRYHDEDISSTSPQSASDKLYQSHQELLQRNRLSAHQQHLLSPHHRGTSYPPPSPTRAYLKRGLAFSYSFKNPPLSKMGHVNSQSQVQTEHGSPSTGQQGKHGSSSTGQQGKHGSPSIGQQGKHASPSTSQGKGDRSAVTPSPPAASTDKAEKKSKQFISRNKGGSKGSSNAASPSGAAGKSITSGKAGGNRKAKTSGKPETSATSEPCTSGTSNAAHTSGTAGTNGVEITSDSQLKDLPGTSSSADTSGSPGNVDAHQKAIAGVKSVSDGKADTSGKIDSNNKQPKTGAATESPKDAGTGDTAGNSGAKDVSTGKGASSSGASGTRKGGGSSGEKGTGGTASTSGASDMGEGSGASGSRDFDDAEAGPSGLSGSTGKVRKGLKPVRNEDKLD